MIGGKDFQLPLDKESKLKVHLGGVPNEGEKYLVFWGKKKEKNGSVRRRLIFMCGKVLFKKKIKKCVQTRAWKEVVV